MRGSEYSKVREAERDHVRGRVKRGATRTFTGQLFTYCPVRQESIRIQDIAHALSNICRFNGHTKEFYSVAQHSMLVAFQMPGTPEEKLAALLHDAAEAYVCDIPSPMKPYLGEPYLDLFAEVQAVIHKMYGVVQIPRQISLYDRAAVLFEAEAFFDYSQDELKALGFDLSLQGLWSPWSPKYYADEERDNTHKAIEADFLWMFDRLMIECKREELRV